jgi:hypothetical protein
MSIEKYNKKCDRQNEIAKLFREVLSSQHNCNDKILIKRTTTSCTKFINPMEVFVLNNHSFDQTLYKHIENSNIIE